jgi:hypothetical protein
MKKTFEYKFNIGDIVRKKDINKLYEIRKITFEMVGEGDGLVYLIGKQMPSVNCEASFSFYVLEEDLELFQSKGSR